MHSWSIHRLARVHPELGHIQHNVEHRIDDGSASPRTSNQYNFSIAGYDGG
jgi:hypothetical protein